MDADTNAEPLPNAVEPPRSEEGPTLESLTREVRFRRLRNGVEHVARFEMGSDRENTRCILEHAWNTNSEIIADSATPLAAILSAVDAAPTDRSSDNA